MASSRPAKVQITIDRDLKRRWHEASRALRRTQRAGARAWDERWETIAEIVEHDPPLYLAGGYASAKHFLADHVEGSVRHAKRMMRVARYASPDDEVRYGISKLDAAISYLDAKTGGIQGRLPVDLAKLRIPIERNGKRRRPLLQQATVGEIRAATRKLRRAARASHPKASPAVVAVQRALTKAGLAGVSVRLVSSQLSLAHIPLQKLPALARALSRTKLPT